MKSSRSILYLATKHDVEMPIAQHVAHVVHDGMSPQEQVVAIRERVVALQERADALVQGELLPALEKERIRIVHWDQLADDDKEFLGRRFRERIFPTAGPQTQQADGAPGRAASGHSRWARATASRRSCSRGTRRA